VEIRSRCLLATQFPKVKVKRNLQNYLKEKRGVDHVFDDNISCNGLNLGKIHTSTSRDSSCTVIYICSSAYLRCCSVCSELKDHVFCYVFCSVCCPLNEAAGSTFMTYL
jgi:hypothetical protein